VQAPSDIAGDNPLIAVEAPMSAPSDRSGTGPVSAANGEDFRGRALR